MNLEDIKLMDVKVLERIMDQFNFYHCSISHGNRFAPNFRNI